MEKIKKIKETLSNLPGAQKTLKGSQQHFKEIMHKQLDQQTMTDGRQQAQSLIEKKATTSNDPTPTFTEPTPSPSRLKQMVLAEALMHRGGRQRRQR